MKTLFTILLITICGFAQAQKKAVFSYYSQETLNAIGTTQEQKDKIAEIRTTIGAKIRETTANTNLTEEEKKAEYKVSYAIGSKLYNEALTAEQMLKLKEYIIKFKKDNP